MNKENKKTPTQISDGIDTGSRFKKRVSGYIESCNLGTISGWAFDPKTPSSPSVVQLYAEQLLIAEGLADQYRTDLKQAGIGTGKHGFNLKLSPGLPIGEPLTIKLLCNENWVPEAHFELLLKDGYLITLRSIEGRYLNGEIVPVSSECPAVIGYQVFIDGLPVGGQKTCLDEKSGNYPISNMLPVDAFDGMPHIVSIALDDAPACQAAIAEVLRPIQTDWKWLSTAINGETLFYGGLAISESRRMALLHSRVSKAVAENRLKDIPPLWSAYQILNEGYENRATFPKLNLPKAVGIPDVSIIIPVHNQFELTFHCLASLILSENRCTYEVIVVDDCSTDKTTEIKNFVSNIKLIINHSNQGFLRNCNKAAKLAKGRYIALLNNDTEVGNHWLDEMLEVFQRFGRVGLVGAKLLYPNGRLQEAGGIIWDNGQPWNLGREGNSFAPEWNYVRQCDYVSGAALMLPKVLWEEVEGLSDEFAPCYYEDTDLAFKVRAAGYRTFFCPHAEVIHFEGKSHGTDVNQGFKKYQTINRSKFASKWIESYAHNGREGTELWKNKERGVRFRALVIDYATPEPEKNAGAYAAIQEISLLQAHGFKVTFIPENMAHFGRYTTDLQKMGVECIHSPFFVSIEDLLKKRGQEFDLVFITRYNVAEKYIDLIRKHSEAKVLFNNADLHFLRELRSSLSKGQTDLTGPLATRDRELALMRKVDAILSYNESEHAVITSHNLRNDNIFKCPWIIPARGHTTPFEKRKGIAFLGGYRHHPNVEAVEFFVEKVMPLLRAKRKDITLHIYGSNPPKHFGALEDENIVVEGFVETLDQVFESCRLFIAPLLSGAGIKGKVLEAMSWGVPSVLSPVAAEATGLTSGINTSVAETPEEWVEAILSLYDDQPTWQMFSDNCLSLARNNYSFDNGFKLIAKPLEHLGFFSGKKSTYVLAR